MTNYNECPKPQDLYQAGPEPISITTTSAPVIQPSGIMANSCVNKDDKCNYISTA